MGSITSKRIENSPSKSESPRAVPPARLGTRYVVTIERVRCKVCGSTRIKTDRSTTYDDGTIYRRATCRDCKAPLAVFVE